MSSSAHEKLESGDERETSLLAADESLAFSLNDDAEEQVCDNNKKHCVNYNIFVFMTLGQKN